MLSLTYKPLTLIVIIVSVIMLSLVAPKIKPDFIAG
jgi:hypothetical protein